MPARQIRPTRSQDPEYLAELGGVLLAMTDTQRREFLAGLDRDNLEVAERALAARIAVSWRATPATMAHYLEPESFELYDYWRLLGELFAGAFRGTDEPHQQWWVASQYGKTSLMANWGPVWALDMNPRLRLMYVSYDADKAVEEVGKARDIAERHYGHLRFRLRPDKRARGMWSTPQGGGLYAVGINGAIVGYPADGMLLDDLLKGWVEAHSPATRNRVWSIYRSQIRMRMQSETCPILCAGCLSADSRVPLVDGRWVPIIDVKPGDEVWAWGGAGLVSRKVLGQRKSGTSDTITVRTSRLSLTATGWHPFLVISPDGHVRPEWAVEWRRADALQVGDLIVTMGEAATDGAAPVDGWEQPDRMWLLGFLFGDGWVTSWARRNWYPQGNRYVHSRSWAVCVALGIDEALNERVAVAIEEAFGRRPRRNDGPRYWRLDCNDAGRTLGLLGLTPGRAADKRIPAWVFGLPTAAQRAFLQGLLDADGHRLVRGFGQTLELGNPDLVEDARLLSMLCGVRVGTRRIRTRVIQPPNSPKPVVHTSAAALFTIDGRDVRGGSFITGDVPAGIRVERVRSITPAPTQDVYDLEVDGDESFVAEGFVVHNTRWHMDDVQARLLQLEEAEPAADHWKVTRLATVAEAPNPASSDPILRLPDPLGREVGQVLEPRRFSEREVATRFATLGSYLAGSLEQQRPSPEEGGEIKRGWFRIAAQLPDHADDWLSSTDPKLKDKESGDFVVVQVWARTGKDYWLVDQLRGQWSQAMTINAICLLSVRHPQVRRHVIENTGNGPEVMETLRTAMPDYVISEEMRSELGMTTEEAAAVEAVRHRGLGGLIPNTPRGSKSVRMRAVSPLIEAGDVHLPDPTRVTWVAGLLDELAAFGSGSGHDDQCDALSQALSRLSHGTASVASPASAPLPTGGPSVRTGARFGVIPGARVR